MSHTCSFEGDELTENIIPASWVKLLVRCRRRDLNSGPSFLASFIVGIIILVSVVWLLMAVLAVVAVVVVVVERPVPVPVLGSGAAAGVL
jgi:hypothetical protein